MIVESLIYITTKKERNVANNYVFFIIFGLSLVSLVDIFKELVAANSFFIQLFIIFTPFILFLVE